MDGTGSGLSRGGQLFLVNGLESRVGRPEERLGGALQLRDEDGEMGVPAGGEAAERRQVIAAAAMGEDHQHLFVLGYELEGHVRVVAEGVTEDARRFAPEDRARHFL